MKNNIFDLTLILTAVFINVLRESQIFAVTKAEQNYQVGWPMVAHI